MSEVPMPPKEWLAELTDATDKAAAGYGWQAGYAAALVVRDAELDGLSQENTHLDLARIELEKWVTQETLRAERAEAEVARLRDGIVQQAARLVRMPIDDEATEDAVRDVGRSLSALVWPRKPAPWEAAAPGRPPAEKEEDPNGP